MERKTGLHLEEILPAVRFNMLTSWLTFTALLVGSVNPERAANGQGALTVAPTCRVKGHPEVELNLNCGDGKNAGVVQFWHTPFGDLETPGFHSKLEPVFMHHDGSLVVPNTSILHSGLYYCLLLHTEGTTLWPYELHVGHNNQKNHEDNEYEQHSSCGAFRFRRGAGSEEEAGVSDKQFAGAVAASVLLTFVLGFSAGALTRTHVLRCLQRVTTRLRPPRRQQRKTDRPDRDSEVTVPPAYHNQVFEMEQEQDGQVKDRQEQDGQVKDRQEQDGQVKDRQEQGGQVKDRQLQDGQANCATTDTSIASTTSFPHVKPQRSFRNKREEEKEITAYLEGCDNIKEEERRMEEEEAGSLEEKNRGCDGEVEEEKREFSGFYFSGYGESRTETDEDECGEGEDEKDGRDSREEKKEWRQEEEVEEAGEQENRSKEDGEARRGSDEEKERDEKRGEKEGWREKKQGNDGEEKREEEDVETDRDSEQSSTETEDDETGSRTQDTINIPGDPSSSPPCPRRRSRIIRLYQYDEDGQRYCHLPDPAPEEPGPAPRLKQRSLSLTRLNAIMAAASAGPLDTRETGKEETEERAHFHMDI